MHLRQQYVDRFQRKEKDWLIIGNIQAMGVGLTLTASSTVAFAEWAWTPGEHDQAEDRVLRIGQKAKNMNAYYFMASGTIEEKMPDIIGTKRRIVRRVLDGKSAKIETVNQIVEYLFKEKENGKQ